MWGAYTVFERLVPAAVLEKIMGTPLCMPSARLGSSYADPRSTGSTCPDPPATVDNVHALIGWLKRPRLRPATRNRGVSPSHRRAGGDRRSRPEPKSRRSKQSLREIEQGTYDTWQPVVLAALPDSVDAKKIINWGRSEVLSACT